MVVLGFGIYIHRLQKEQTETLANEALLQLKTPAQPTNAPPPSPSAFLKVASEYASTSVAERAELLAAGALFEENKYSEAEALFAKFLKERANSQLAATAAYGVAASLEAQGKQTEAISAYQTVITRFPKSGAAVEARLNLGRVHEGRNEFDKALQYYSEVAKMNSYWSRDAGVHRERLTKAHPELKNPVPTAPTPTPTAPPTGAVKLDETGAPSTQPAPAPPPAK